MNNSEVEEQFLETRFNSETLVRFSSCIITIIHCLSSKDASNHKYHQERLWRVNGIIELWRYFFIIGISITHKNNRLYLFQLYQPMIVFHHIWNMTTHLSLIDFLPLFSGFSLFFQENTEKWAEMGERGFRQYGRKNWENPKVSVTIVIW